MLLQFDCQCGVFISRKVDTEIKFILLIHSREACAVYALFKIKIVNIIINNHCHRMWPKVIWENTFRRAPLFNAKKANWSCGSPNQDWFQPANEKPWFLLINQSGLTLVLANQKPWFFLDQPIRAHDWSSPFVVAAMIGPCWLGVVINGTWGVQHKCCKLDRFCTNGVIISGKMLEAKKLKGYPKAKQTKEDSSPGQGGTRKGGMAK